MGTQSTWGISEGIFITPPVLVGKSNQSNVMYSSGLLEHWTGLSGPTTKCALFLLIIGACISGPDATLGGAAVARAVHDSPFDDMAVLVTAYGGVNGCGSIGAILVGVAINLV